MERTKHIIIAVALSLSLSVVLASNRTSIYQAFIGNKMEEWKRTVDDMEQKQPFHNDQLLELVNYQYGYIAWCIGNQRMKEARIYLDRAYSTLKKLKENQGNASIVSAYEAAFYGFEIGLAQYKAPYYGLKSIDAVKNALALDPKNWMAYIQSGNIQYYMPAIFGGSKNEALQLYKKAQVLMEKDPNNIHENWNYLNLLLQLGEGHAQRKDFDQAAAYYEKIISLEPRFLWVKNELYPKIIEQINQQ